MDTASELGIPLKVGKIITADVFDPYAFDQENFKSCFPTDNYLASEMEAFGLFYLAHKMNRQAACLITVVDSKHDKRAMTSEERQKSLNEMITIALETL
jgi:purine-nucleoside phosphorylase